jgi:hypothetical protein
MLSIERITRATKTKSAFAFLGRAGKLPSTALLGAAALMSSCMPTLIFQGTLSPNTILIQSGNQQTGSVGAALSAPLAVTVNNSSGQAVSGAQINWSVSTGGGTLSVGSSVTNASGIASANYTLGTLAGTNTLIATLAGSTTVVAFTETATPGPAQAATSTVTAALSAVAANGATDLVTVTVKDLYGNPVSGKTVTLSATPSTGVTIGAASGTSNSSGQLTFTVSSVNSGAVVFSATDVTDGVSILPSVASVTFTALTPTKLAFAIQPSSSGSAGTTLSQQPRVTVEDANGYTVSSSSATTTLTLFGDAGCSTTPISTNPAGGASVLNSSVLASSGQAQFSNLAITASGTSLYLKASSAGLTSACSSLTNISTASVSTGVSTVSAASASVTANGTGDVITLTLKDPYGNPIAGKTATLAASPSAGVTVGAASGASNSSGVVSFTVSSITSGSVTFTATDTTDTTVITQTAGVSFTSGTASKLAFSTQPSSTGTAGTALAQQPVVKVEDSNGNIVTSSTATIALNLYADSGCSTTPVATNPASGASVTGASATAASGTAPFTTVTVTDASHTLYLQASSSGLLSACSSVMNISSSTVNTASSTVSAASGSVTANGTSDVITVTLLDVYGNPVSGKTVTLVGAPSTGLTMGAASGASSALGVVTFTVSSLTEEAVVFTATDTTDAKTITQTANVSFTAGTPYKLVYSTQPSNTGTAGAFLAQQPVVQIQDSNGNLTSSTATVALSLYGDSSCSTTLISTNPSAGTAVTGGSASASAGTATFTAAKITDAATTLYLQASSSGLVSACSSVINISSSTVNIASSTVSAASGSVTANGTSDVITVTLLDVYGNPVSGKTVTLAGAPSTGLTIGSASGASSALGVVTFSVSSNTAETVSFTATDVTDGVMITQIATVNFTAGVATQLAITTAPSVTGTAGTALAQQPVVQVEDANGNLVSSSSATILFSLYGDSGCSSTPLATSPSGSASVAGGSATASSGIATFTSLAVTDAVSTLYLQASSSGLTSSCSSLLNISAGSVSASTSTLTAASSPYAVTGTGDFMTVTLKDAYGNVVSGKTVTLAGAPSTGVTISAASGASNSSGIVTFTANSSTLQTVVFTTTDTTDSLAVTQTTSVNFVAGPAYQLAYFTQPSTSTFSGIALAQQPVVWVEDASGNKITTSSASVTLGLYLDSACTLPATATSSGISTSASSGAATFTNFTVSTTGAFYVGASATGLLTACSVGVLGVGWTVEDGAASDSASGQAIAIDSSGNLYVTGYTTRAIDGQTLHGSQDFFITKYNSSGTRLWTVEDGTASAMVSGYGIAVDSSANVYVTGRTTKALDGQTLHGSQDFFITKYNTSGTRLWTVEDGTASGTANGYAIAVDSSANVYVTGGTSKAIDAQTLLGTNDFFITKYNTSGTRQWTVEDGAASDTAIGYGIAVDSSGNAYVTGQTSKAIDGQTLLGNQDFFITKYNTSGTRQWTVEDGAASDGATGYGIAVDSSGNAYVSGTTTTAIDGQTVVQTSNDYFITKYNTSGTRQWTILDGGLIINPTSITLDSLGNFYVAGSNFNIVVKLDGQAGTGTSLFITKYNSSGTRQWTTEDSTTGSGNNSVYGYGIAVDSLGNTYTTGQTQKAIDGQTLHGTYDFFIKQN